jgi:hypothetical protein
MTLPSQLENEVKCLTYIYLTSGGLGVASVGQVVNTLARKHTEKRYSWEKTPCYLPGKPIAPDIDKSLQANSERLL